MAIVETADAPNDDVALLRRMAQGDEASVRQVYETYGDPLFRFIRRRYHGPIEDAEEIVADVFLSALRHGATFEGQCSLFTWLCAVARSRIGDQRRNASRGNRIPRRSLISMDDEAHGLARRVHDASVTPQEIVERLDRVRLVENLLAKLTPEQREAVTLRYVEQFSVAEIARIMNRSEKAAERLLERAKTRPRQEMLRWFGHEEFRALCFEVLVL